MNYTINFEDVDYDLADYNFKIAEQIQNAEKNKKGLKDHCHKMYDVCCSCVGKAKIGEILGDFNSVDPNRVQMMFWTIRDTYSEPVTQNQIENISNKVEQLGIDKLASIIDNLDKLEKFNNDKH